MPFIYDGIIVDIDGTLTDNHQRTKDLIIDKRDFDTFFKELHKDKLNYWCYTLIEAYRELGMKIFILTGRQKKYLSQTVNWLHNNDIYYDGLLMRKDNDLRNSSEVKKDLYLKYLHNKVNILFAIDDQKPCVDMWRSIGITCLQCNDIYIEEEKLK